MSSVLVLDTGSANVRAAIVRDATQVVRSQRRTYLEFVPDDAPAGREWDPGDMARCAHEAIGAALEGDAAPDAVVVTTQRLAVVLVDAGGNVLFASGNNDGRGLMEAAALHDRLGDRIAATTGHQPPIVLAAPRVEWLRAQRPAVVERTAHLMTLADWFVFHLTGEIRSEPSVAGDTGLLSLATRSWDDALSAECGVDPSWLPPLGEAGEIAGTVSAAAAAATGLREGTPVILGAGDTMAALVGLGVDSPGSVGVVAGSTMPVCVVGDRVRTDPSGRCWAGCTVHPDRWLVEANCGEAGIAQSWMATVMGCTPEELHELAAAAPPAPGVPSVLGPSPMDFSDLPLLRSGALRFSVPVGHLGPDRASVARTFVDNLAYAARLGLEWLDVDPGPIALGGGLAESKLFPHVLSSVLGRPVDVFDGDVTVRGAAACAEVALGHFADLHEAARQAASRATVTEPVAGWTDVYAAAYPAWRALDERLASEAVRFSSLLTPPTTASGA